VFSVVGKSSTGPNPQEDEGADTGGMFSLLSGDTDTFPDCLVHFAARDDLEDSFDFFFLFFPVPLDRPASKGVVSPSPVVTFLCEPAFMFCDELDINGC
jgi:hypothetical protein